jgi:hypothetical protein
MRQKGIGYTFRWKDYIVIPELTNATFNYNAVQALEKDTIKSDHELSANTKRVFYFF